MKLAPIALFVYNRIDHTHRTVQALLKNKLAEDSNLFIFSDAPKSPDVEHEVLKVREYIKKIKGFSTVSIIERDVNFGLAKSIINGVSAVLKDCDSIIVLEDDLVTSPYFLSYMNEALEKYAEDNRVISIHGYVYPVKQSLPEAFLLRGADCWGWATWRRGWAHFNADSQYLINELKRRNLINQFDFDGAFPYSKMLKGQIKGTNDSWAVRWYASAFLADKLTLYPGRSLVQNIGFDDSGTHCHVTERFDVNFSSTRINLKNVSFEPSAVARQSFEDYFRQGQMGLWDRLILKARILLGLNR